MRYTAAGAFRTALEQRLRTLAAETDAPLIRLRKLVTFDRLMARLMAVAPNRWVLKRAVALHFRLGPHYRTTKDIDLGRLDDEPAATADFLAAQALDLGDFFTFGIQRTGQFDEALEGAAVRYHASAQLAGRPFEDVTVDVGFGDPVVPDPEMVRGAELLSFADIAPAEVPALPIERHIAEKVHAYTRTYEGGRPSSRVKDLVDLVMMASSFGLQAGRLRRALEATFSARNTHPLPSQFPPPQQDWRVPYRKTAEEVNLNPDIRLGYERARRFLDPILAGSTADDARWDPMRHTW
jgi:hypothetical protein